MKNITLGIVPTRPSYTKVLIFTIVLYVFCLNAFAQTPVIHSGTWIQKGYPISGNWEIVSQGENKIIVFDENFKTKNGPDLKIYLSHADITTLKGSQVESSSIKLGLLKSHKGKQSYVIPNKINLSQYKSIVIHCEAFSHLWGGANFNE